MEMLCLLAACWGIVHRSSDPVEALIMTLGLTIVATFQSCRQTFDLFIGACTG